MGREARSRLAEAAEVDDLPHPRGAGRLAEVPGGEAILLLERGARRHRVDQVVRRVDARERRVERLPPQAVARDDLGARGDPGGEALRPPGEAANAVSALRERAQEPAADVAGRARQEDQPGPGVLWRFQHAVIVQPPSSPPFPNDRGDARTCEIFRTPVGRRASDGCTARRTNPASPRRASRGTGRLCPLRVRDGAPRAGSPARLPSRPGDRGPGEPPRRPCPPGRPRRDRGAPDGRPREATAATRRPTAESSGASGSSTARSRRSAPFTAS